MSVAQRLLGMLDEGQTCCRTTLGIYVTYYLHCLRLVWYVLVGDGRDGDMIRLDTVLSQCDGVGREHEFIKSIIDTIPQAARAVGVSSQSSLEQRFQSVVGECKKVALYPNNTNLVAQTLSSVYSRLLRYSVKPRFLSEEDFVSTDGMDTKDLLIQAQYFMGKHCLTAAVKCMNQLEGLPRTLASDWIEEARLLLEVRQAASAVHSYAMSKALGYVV